MDLTGRTVLVTGASSGIGREASVFLSQLGARLVLVGRNAEALEETKARLEGEGHVASPYDLNDTAGIPAWIKGVAAETGPLSGLVHSAGLHLTRPVRTYVPSDIQDIFRVNVEAGAMLVKGFRQKGVKAEASSVVLIASVVGLVGQPGVGLYSASKGALIALAKSMALELAGEKIRVNCIAPAVVETEMTGALREKLTEDQYEKILQVHPLGLGTPRDVANSVGFLLSDAARWITGSTLVVDGGYTAH